MEWKRKSLTVVGAAHSGKQSFVKIYSGQQLGSTSLAEELGVKFDLQDSSGKITTVREIGNIEESFHQFLLPRNSLYAITINLLSLLGEESQREECVTNLRYWLSMITTHTSSSQQPHGSPILLIGTHASDISTTSLQEISAALKTVLTSHAAWRNVQTCFGPQSSQQLCFFPIDCQDGSDSLEMQHIRLNLDDLFASTTTTQQVSPHWVAATEYLRANLADWTSLTEIARVCATRYAMPPSEVPQLLSFLHDQGVVLWYDQPSKRDVVLFDPATTLLPRLLALTGSGSTPRQRVDSPVGVEEQRLHPARVNQGLLAALLAQKGYQMPRTPQGLRLALPFLQPPATEADWARAQWPTTTNTATTTSIYTVFTTQEQLYYYSLDAADLKRAGFLPAGVYNLVFLEILKWASLQATQRAGKTENEAQRDLVLHQNMAVLYYKNQPFRLSYCAEQHFLRLDVEGGNPLGIQRKLLNTVGAALRGAVAHLEYFSAVLYKPVASSVSTTAPTAAAASAEDVAGLKAGEVLVPLVKLHRCVQSHQPLRANNRQRLLEESGVRALFGRQLQLLPTLQLYDVFISYRWTHNDHDWADHLFEAFGTARTQSDDSGGTRAVEAFQDWRRVDVGPGFIPQFSMAVPHSLVGLPVVSVEALERMLTHIPSAIDNVLLEWTLMLECFTAKRMRKIFPVLVGAQDDALSAGVKDFKSDPSLHQLPNTIPTATLAQAAKILKDNNLFPSAGFFTRTVASIVHDIVRFEGCNAAFFDRYEVKEHIAGRVTELLDEIFAQDHSDDIPALVARALRRGSKEWRRSKLSVVGEGRAGKTALTNAIIGRAFEDTASTIGINQLTCDVKHVKTSGGVGAGHQQQSVGIGEREGELEVQLRWTECRREDRELESALAESVAVLKLRISRGESYGLGDSNGDILSLLMTAKATAASSTTNSTNNASASAGQRNQAAAGTAASAASGPAHGASVMAGPLGANSSSPSSSGNASPSNRGGGASSPYGSTSTTNTQSMPKNAPTDRPLDEDMVMRALATITDAETGLLISLFDFGGQSVFDVIHHMFLTRNGVYALVFNMEWLLATDTADRNRALRLLHRWLSSVAVHTFDATTQRTAPVVFVGTRLDSVASPQQHQEISRILYDTFSDHPAWTSVIENLNEQDAIGRVHLWFFPVSNPAGCRSDAMRTLMDTVHSAMDKAAYTHKEVPLTWFKVIDQLRDTEKDCLSLQEVEAIGARCNVSEQEVPYLLTFLHDMGHLMWLDEPELRDVVILDAVKFLVTPATIIICNIVPGAGESVLHAVPAHHECAHQCKDEWNALRRDGVLHVKLLPILWREYAERTEILLLLMVKFGLLVPLRPEQGFKGASVASAGGASTPPPSPSSEAPLVYIAPALLVPAPAVAQGVYDWTDQPVSSVYFVFTLSEEKLQSNCAIDSEDLKSNGFLPGGMFERIVGKALSWSQDTAKGGRLNLRSVILHKDVVVMAFGRQRFRLVHCADIHCVRVDIEGTHPLGVLQKLQAIIDKIIAECMTFLRWFPALSYASPTTTIADRADDPLHKALLATEVLMPLALVREAAVGEVVLTWRGGRVMMTEEQVRTSYGQWLQIYGLREQFDVFISYRWGSYDSVFTEQLFDVFTNYTVGLSNRAVEVFLDVKCLQKGQLFKADFAAALTHCHIALPVLSIDALQRMHRHRANEVDNVLLEWVMILECFAAKRLQKVFPIVFGERVKSGMTGNRLTISDYFADCRVKTLPVTVPTATLAKADELLRANGIEPSSKLATYTVRGIVHQLPEFLLCKAHVIEPVELVETYVKEALSLLKQCNIDPPTPPPPPPPAPSVPSAPSAESGALASVASTTLTPAPAPAVKRLRDLTAAEVATLVDRVGFPGESATFASLRVTGALLNCCREAAHLQKPQFGVEDFIAEGLFEFVQEWKTVGVPTALL